MPTPQEMLQGLTAIANENVWLAIAWHVAIVAGLIPIALGWRPSRFLAAVALMIPLASVSTLAWLYYNPFNGIAFSVLGGLLFVIGLRLPAAPVSAGPTWAKVAGAVLLAFGWGYPHFLTGRDSIAYLYAAPTGLVPCPTLSLVIGLALLANGFGSRVLSLTLAAFGAFYGAFGMLRLGVTMDGVLLAGAVALAIHAFTSTTPGRAGTAQPA